MCWGGECAGGGGGGGGPRAQSSPSPLLILHSTAEGTHRAIHQPAADEEAGEEWEVGEEGGRGSCVHCS